MSDTQGAAYAAPLTPEELTFRHLSRELDAQLVFTLQHLRHVLENPEEYMPGWGPLPMADALHVALADSRVQATLRALDDVRKEYTNAQHALRDAATRARVGTPIP